MRILHVVPSYLPAWRYGGPIRSVHGLARAQVAAGDAVEVFTTDADGPGRLDVPTGVPVDRDGVDVTYFRRVRPQRLCRAPALGRALRDRIRDFDVVHLHSVFLDPTRVAARIAERAQVPHFASPRGMLVRALIDERGGARKRLWIGLVERRTLARSAGIVVQSELERRELEALALAVAPVHVVANGIDFDDMEAGLQEPVPESIASLVEGAPFVLFLGRLSWKKGLDRLLDAMAEVPGARLVVAGNDEENLHPELERRAARLGIGERTSFVGEVRGAAKWALLRAAAVCCLPSRSESFGIAALEAMAAGTPTVVSSAVGLAGFPEVAGALVAVDAAPAGLAAVLRGLLEDRDRARRLGERGAEVARGSFAWPAIAARMRSVYGSR